MIHMGPSPPNWRNMDDLGGLGCFVRVRFRNSFEGKEVYIPIAQRVVHEDVPILRFRADQFGGAPGRAADGKTARISKRKSQKSLAAFFGPIGRPGPKLF